MISCRTTNPAIWDCTPSVLPELFEQLVEYVSERGGKYIAIKDWFMTVENAMKQKKLVDRYALEAHMMLALYENASNLGDQLAYKNKMKQAAFLAGANFRLYVRDIGSYAKPKVTSLISDRPILKKSWDEGYAFEELQLYSED